MKNRFFSRMSVLTLVAVVLVSFSASAKRATITGRVLCDGKGVAGVTVTDGNVFTKTNEAGEYSLSSNLDYSHFVQITVPSGYEVPCEGAVPQFFHRLDRSGSNKQSFDFTLSKVDQSNYVVLTFADSHVLGGGTRGSHRDVERFNTQLMPVVKSYIDEQKAKGKPCYIVHLGDMTQPGGWPERRRDGRRGYGLDDYIRDMNIGTPVFSALGNHDHNPSPKGTVFDESTVYQSRANFMKMVGPAYYSFDIGREHYIVIDNTFVLTKDSGCNSYEGATSGYQYRVCEQQMSWMEKDIDLLDAKKYDRIVLCVHNPLHKGNGGSRMLRADRLINAFKGFEMLVLSGHSHGDTTIRVEHNGKECIEIVHPSTAGTAWYTSWCVEGSPGCVEAFHFGGERIKRDFVPWGEAHEKGLTYRVYDNVHNKWHYPIKSSTGKKWSRARDIEESHYRDKPAIIVNIWGAYTCTFTESTGGTGNVDNRCYDLAYRDWYWDYYERSLNEEFEYGDRLRKANWQTPTNGRTHCWRYTPADPTAVVTVEAKDVWGNVIAKFTAQAAE